MGFFKQAWSMIRPGVQAVSKTVSRLPAPTSSLLADLSTNGQVVKYLDFYREAKSPLNYAVMLDGEWGSGKTFFIKRYIEERAKGEAGKFLYISLYGVSAAGDIDDQIFQQLHPFLASKPVAILSKVLKGAVKAGIKYDFEGDGDSGFSADVNTPDIKASDLFGRAKNAILVFDDLERCPMPIDQVLGYINYFVEHHNHRAILLANESEIEKEAEANDSQYHKIKEKLVGRTFKIVPVVDDALPAFVGAVGDGPARDVLLKNVELIRRVYDSAKYNNLRSLKQALTEFSTLFEMLPAKAKAHADLLSDVIQTLLILTLEIRRDAAFADQIPGIGSKSISGGLKKNDKEPKHPLLVIEEKYASFSFHALCPSDECWHQFFTHGAIPRALLEESVNNSIHFRHENIDAWVKLWYYTELEESEFATLVKEVEANFDALKYTRPGVIRHITGMYLRFSKTKMIDRSTDQVKDWIESTVLKIYANGALEREENDRVRYYDGYHSLGFQEKESPEFKAVFELLDDLREKSIQDDLPNVAAELLQLAETNSRQFWERMSQRFAAGHRYSDVPIMLHISPKDFAGAMVRCPNPEKKNITFALKDRYESANHHTELAKELPWLRAVKIELETNAAQQGRLGRHLLTHFVSESIDAAIRKLEAVGASPGTS